MSLPPLLCQSSEEYLLTMPSSLRLGAPYPEHVCVELLRKRAKATMKVEVFKRKEGKYSSDAAQSPDEFEMIKETSFSKVGKQ